MKSHADRSCPDPSTLFAELEVVAADPVFNRSPAQLRMLRFLVEATAAGDGPSLKSYTLAVEGLGRDSDFDAQTNTYSRVLAARLRRSLDAYYRGPGKDRPWRLEIPHGTYEVAVVPNTAEVPVPLPLLPFVTSLGQRSRLIRLAAAFAGTLILAGVLYLFVDAKADAERWRTPNFPLVAIEVLEPGAPDQAEKMAVVSRAFASALRQYDSVRLAYRADPKTEYVLVLSPGRIEGGEVRVDLIDERRNRRLYSGTLAISGGGELTADERLALERTAFRLFGFAGQVTVIETRFSSSADTPFDCWLRFSNSVVVEGLAADPDLLQCAQDWHENAPRHPMAAALYAWTLASATLRNPPGSRRDEQLAKALRIAEMAHSIDPESRLALVSLARIYGFMGKTGSLLELSRDVKAKGDFNPDVYTTIGLLRVLQNDLSGEADIDRAVAFHPDPPPRYSLGKFIAAMMRDDTAGAGAALERILLDDRSSSWSVILQTAYLAHTGQMAEARQAWKSGTADRPLLRLFPRYYIGNAPAAPEVKQRLGQWLAPVIDE